MLIGNLYAGNAAHGFAKHGDVLVANPEVESEHVVGSAREAPEGFGVYLLFDAARAVLAELEQFEQDLRRRHAQRKLGVD